MSRPRKDPFTMRRYEAERKALLREGPPPAQLCDEDFCSRSHRGEWYFTDKRVYCARRGCGTLKGSEKKNVYYPDEPCCSCGNTRAVLVDFDHNRIDWEKWVIIFGEKEEKSYYGPLAYEY